VTTPHPPTSHGDAGLGSQHLIQAIRKKELEVKRIPDEPVRGPRGEYMTRREARERHDFLKTRIDADEVGHSLRHRTVPRSTLALTLIFLVLIDFPVMLWLVSAVFNVDWAHPVGLRLVISIVLSLLATAGAAWVLYHMGHIRRDDKNDRRELDWPNMSRTARISLIMVAALVILVSIVMFVRVFTEGELSGLSGLALMLAVLIALIMLLSAALVFFTAFRDGSAEQEDLAHYSALVHEGQWRQHKLEDEIERFRSEYAMLHNNSATGADKASRADVDGLVTRIRDARGPHPSWNTSGTATDPGGADRSTP
jgi:protein-S-isoprenylcysteine O-methyltransferase Ste14